MTAATSQPRAVAPDVAHDTSPRVRHDRTGPRSVAPAGDTVHELYPGSGGITRAWHAYTTKPTVRKDRPA